MNFTAFITLAAWAWLSHFHVRFFGHLGTYLAHTKILGCEFTWVLILAQVPLLTLITDCTCFCTSVCVMLRVISICCTDTNLFVLLRILRFSMVRSIGLLLYQNIAWLTLPILNNWLPIYTFWSLISLQSQRRSILACVKSLSVRESLPIFFIDLFSFHIFRVNGIHLNFVDWTIALLGNSLLSLKHILSIDMWLSCIYCVLSLISSQVTPCRLMASSIPLSLWCSLLHHSTEACSYVLSTLVDVWVYNSVCIISMVICVLIHTQLWWMLVLSLLQLIESLVKLNIAELLFNATMCILGNVSTLRVSLCTSCWATAGHAMICSWSKSSEDICWSDWGVVIMGWLSSKLAV